MTKIFCFTLLIVSFQLIGISQNNINFIDSIAENICIELENEETIISLNDSNFKNVLYKAIEEYQLEWNSLNKEIMKDEKFSVSYLDYLLQHRLLQTCPRFRELDNNFQTRVYLDDSFIKPYLTLKSFVLDSESDIEPQELTKYFSTEINRTELIEKISRLQTCLQKYKRTSVLFVNNRGDQLYYYVSIMDYSTGEDLAAIMLLFNDAKDDLIDDWDFRTKSELNQVDEEIIIDDEMIRITREEYQKSEQDTLKK